MNLSFLNLLLVWHFGVSNKERNDYEKLTPRNLALAVVRLTVWFLGLRTDLEENVEKFETLNQKSHRLLCAEFSGHSGESMKDHNTKRNMTREGKPHEVSERTEDMRGPWLEAMHFTCWKRTSYVLPLH